MKIRVTIHLFGSHNNSNSIFSHTWKRFLDNNIDKLPRFEFVFINNNLNNECIEKSTTGYETLHMVKIIPPHFDTDSNYFGLSSGKNTDADYLMRLDPETLPTVKSFNSIADFLEGHSDVTFVSASNFPRSVFHHLGDHIPPLDNSAVGKVGSKNFPWHPWGFPTNNGDLFIFKRDFFNECDSAYKANAIIINNKIRVESPFHSQVLKYHDICDLLGQTPREDIPNTRIFIDGGLRSDFWTTMCRSPNMKMAGIVDHSGKSFSRKNHVITQYNGSLAFKSYSNLVDEVDVSWKHELNIKAPYWHLGNGYLVEWYFDPRAPHFVPSVNHFKPHFIGENYGNYVAHFAIVRLFSELATQDPSLLSDLNNKFIPLIREWGVDVDHFNEHCATVLDFYHDEIKEYM